jgi:hypothetical protein
MRPSFLDHVSATEAGRRRTRGCSRSGKNSWTVTGRRACVVGNEMSRGYFLEYPVDDPDDDEDDEDDEDDGDEEDEETDEEEGETWQVSGWTGLSPKGWSLLDFRD